MKNLHILLLSLACSTTVLAQTPDTQWVDMTAGQGIVEEALPEEMFTDETLPEEMVAGGELSEEIFVEDENTLSEQIIADSNFSGERLLQIQYDCSVLAQDEGVEQEFVTDFVEVCVIDSVSTELADNQEEEVIETEILSEEYAEAPVEDDFIETVAE